MDGLRAPSQNSSVTGFKAQTRRVNGHVRSGFENDANHTEGRSHPADLKAIGLEGHVRDFADRVIQRLRPAGGLQPLFQNGRR